MPDRFIQIHTLTSYAGVLLNRDDSGFAKRLPFGGVTRTRVSSQCLKRHWRTHTGVGALQEIDGMDLAVRSRRSLRVYVADPLIAAGGDKELVEAAVVAVAKLLIGKTAGKGDPVEMGQIVVLGKVELDFVRSMVQQFLDNPELKEADLKKLIKGEAKKNLGALANAAGLDAALFGRMTTSDILARGDAAIHVAHSFTVHAEQAEDDYFSAVDDLLAATDGLGSGHIGNTELTSGLFYSYVVVDVPLLVSNLTGCAQADWESADRDIAGQVIQRLLTTIATVSPGAKLGSTAPHAYADMVLVEAGDFQPRTLANAFADPVGGRQTLAQAMAKLSQEAQALDSMYSEMVPARGIAAKVLESEICSGLGVEGGVSLSALAQWAAGRVTG